MRATETELDAAKLQGYLDAGLWSSALELLVRLYDADLRSYVARRVPSAHVDDVCQDVWLAASSGLARYRQACPPRVWLRVLARNKVVDLCRRRPELATLRSSLSTAPEVARLFGVKSPTSPTSQLGRAEAALALEHALEQLDDDDRELVALRFLDDLKPQEIAIMLGMKPNTVSQRIVRAVRLLRELLAVGAP